MTETTAAQPLEVKLTGARRIVLDVDGGDWRVAYYRPELPHAKALELEKRARVSASDRRHLERVKKVRTAARAPSLRDALRNAMSRVESDRYGAPRRIMPPEHEVEQIASYVLECRYAHEQRKRPPVSAGGERA